MKTEELKWYTIETPDARSGLDVYCQNCISDLIDSSWVSEIADLKNLSNGKKCSSCDKPYEP